MVFILFNALFGLMTAHAIESEITSTADLRPEPITLKMAIERALENNLDIQYKKLSLRSSEIYYQDSWEKMYLPQINLSFGTSASRTLSHLGDNNPYSETRGYPNSTARLNLGEYTLYNFGKDKIAFDKDKLDWYRSKEQYIEEQRALKFQVINAYWTLKSRADKLESYEGSVEISQALVNLQNSRLLLNKSTATDVSSATADLFYVKSQRDQALTDTQASRMTLNILLGDPPGKQYQIDDQISFLPIKVSEQTLYDTYSKESPSMKNAKKDLEKAQLSLELAQKQQLPLPTITFSGVSFGYTNNYNGGKTTEQSQYAGQKNIDIAAAISLTIPLTGPGGLFNHRTVEASQIQLDQSEISLKTAAKKDLQSILDFVNSIRQYEQTVENDRQRYKNNMFVLQSVFDSFTSSKNVSRLDIRDAINNARDSEISLTTSLITHLYYKTQLAAFIGVDYLPRME